MRWLTAFLMGLSITAFADQPEHVAIRGVSSFGSGCPAGSASATIAPDGSAFSLLLDNYMAEASAADHKEREKCDIRLDLAVDDGWQFAIVGADYRGFVNIDKGAIAKHKVIYSFDGRRIVDDDGEDDFEGVSSDGLRYGFETTRFRGPISEDYLIHHDVKIRRKPKSFCSRGNGHRLFLSTFLIARAPGGKKKDRRSLITLDSVDGSVTRQQFQLTWFRCR